MDKTRILIVEDDPDGARSVTDAALDAGFAADCVATAAKGLALFTRQPPDVLLTDLVLPDFDGIELMQKVKQIAPDVPVIVMTAYGSVESSVRAMRAGAYDYITKPLDLDDIQAKLHRAAETSRLRREVTNLTATARSNHGVTSMVADSPCMRALLSQIEALASTTATILIQGESGTGKELVARALHTDGNRATGPFIAVNCGAFAESLLESELFGHEKGAFTGAASRHAGAFERAHGGTLFLDEIGDAPPAVQVKLLRAIEEREIRRVGGSETFSINVRLISATNIDLTEAAAEGKFRQDLLYRLNVVTLTIPPLRQRREDIRPLTDRFIARAVSEHQRPVSHIDPTLYERLESYEWPGNIRQLRNVVESAVLLAPEGKLTGSVLNLHNIAGTTVTNQIPPDLTIN